MSFILIIYKPNHVCLGLYYLGILQWYT